MRPVDIPPTLAPPVFSPTTPPLPIVIVASPTPSPSVVLRNPILSGLLPAPDAAVPVGTVNIGARISGAVELAEILMVLDGAAVQPNITPLDPRTWTVAYASKLSIGTHEVRMNAKDADGRAGGYRWQFEVKEKEKEPTRTPRPAPTKAPTKESESSARRRS